ncbi:hypothetical protein [Nocardia sp. alder85J]|uniref:hypothetical protein n=1 Tax=Nocardia sp. alder85J TaxID=2862949 RepID=UPI001CD643B9|nr:hypothetical protein [Nocardia sp. alder85J]MCX4091262.1 hypothetical protein [Nocardia sp. alder85J]
MTTAERAGSRIWPSLLRALTAVVALDGFAQAVFAGRLLAGSYDGLDAHALNAIVLAVGILTETICFALAWRFGSGTARPVFVGLGLIVLTAVQMTTGFRAILAVHVPVGVLLIGGLLGLVVQAWREPAGVAA